MDVAGHPSWPETRPVPHRHPGSHPTMLRTLWRWTAAAAVCIGLTAGPLPTAIAADGASGQPSAPVMSPAASPATSPAASPCPSPMADPSPSASPDVSPSPSPVASAGPTPRERRSRKASPAATAAAAPTASAAPSAPSLPSTAPSPSAEPCVPAPLVLPQIGMGVGPGQVILDATTQEGTFTVYNAGETAQMFAAVAFDYLPALDGKRTATDEPVPLGAAEWLTMDPPLFTLEAGDSQQVTFRVAVPETAAPGDHWAGIRFVTQMTDEAWNALAPLLPEGINLRSQVAFPVTVVTRVPGEITPVIDAPPIPPVIATFTGDSVITTQIQNTGNTAAVWHVPADETGDPQSLVPTLRMTPAGFGIMAEDRLLYATSGPEEAKRPASVMVLPGASLEQRLVLRDVPMFGTYTYQYLLPGDASDGRAPVIRAGKMLVINIQKIMLYIVLPLVGGAVLISALVVLRLQRQQRRRAAAAAQERELRSLRAQLMEQARQEAARRAGRSW